MKKNNIGYLLREGVRGVFLHGFMSFAAVCVTVACLIIMGSFSLILYDLHVMIVDLEKENQVLVYIDENYSEARAKSVGSQINMISNVHEATFVSRQQALDDFIEEQGDEQTFSGLDASTFRDRYVVSMEDSALTLQTVEHIKQIEGVADVSVHYEITNGFQTVQRVLNVASMAIIAVLFVVSLFIISNTVKLSMYGRKEEIAIMKMVGATNRFIRLPFFVEGCLLGLFGSVLSFFIEWGLYEVIRDAILGTNLKVLTVVPFTDVLAPMALICAVAGFFIGIFGSLMSIRRFLKV